MPRERPIINWDEVPVIIDVPYVSISLSFAIFSPAFRYFIALHDLKCYD